MTTISVIFGTRPEAIKLAPVIRALEGCDGIRCHVCVTAQHRQMLDQVMEIFRIVPDVDLDLMEKNQTLGGFTSRAIGQLDRYMGEHRPDLVLVQGDTTTVFCAALAAFYHKIPIGHVEAGLRTGNIYAPWPEEINRVLTSRLATIHFAPTETSRGNLLREGVPGDRITVTGNTVIDALLYARGVVRSHPPEIPSLPPDVIRGWGNRPLVLITGHRRENFGEGFESICRAIAELARTFPETVYVYPVHLNPNVREPVNRLLRGRDNIFLVEPLAYLPFVWMMDRSTLVLTDSGGVQEEAPSLGKPVLVMRNTTERPEGVDAGTARLVGTDFARIVDGVSRLLTDSEEYAAMSKAVNPYGDGHAAERILEVLLKWSRSPR